MSVRRAWIICCDHPGCDAEHNYGRQQQETARLDAQGNHWGERKEGRRWLDLCPEHKDPR